MNIPVDGDSTEIINALKAQIQICTEDFESERRDRERAQAMKMCLEAENEKLKKEVKKKTLKMVKFTFSILNGGSNSTSRTFLLHNCYTMYHDTCEFFFSAINNGHTDFQLA